MNFLTETAFGTMRKRNASHRMFFTCRDPLDDLDLDELKQYLINPHYYLDPWEE